MQDNQAADLADNLRLHLVRRLLSLLSNLLASRVVNLLAGRVVNRPLSLVDFPPYNRPGNRVGSQLHNRQAALADSPLDNRVGSQVPNLVDDRLLSQLYLRHLPRVNQRVSQHTFRVDNPRGSPAEHHLVSPLVNQCAVLQVSLAGLRLDNHQLNHPDSRQGNHQNIHKRYRHHDPRHNHQCNLVDFPMRCRQMSHQPNLPLNHLRVLLGILRVSRLYYRVYLQQHNQRWFHLQPYRLR